MARRAGWYVAELPGDRFGVYYADEVPRSAVAVNGPYSLERAEQVRRDFVGSYAPSLAVNAGENFFTKLMDSFLTKPMPQDPARVRRQKKIQRRVKRARSKIERALKPYWSP